MSSAAIRLHDGAVAIGRPYAERAEEEHGLHDQVAQFLLTTVVAPIHNRLRDPVEALATIVAHVERHEPSMRSMLDEELSVQARGMRIPLRRDGFTLEHVGRCFALAREAAARSIGQRHYRVQLMAGWGLLQGKLVEMETGEGKTIAATLAASAAALAGYPVHVITVNDYLAQRDADEMGPLYRLLGLSVGVVVQGMPKSARRQAYAESITYCTNKELAFDYLRDRVAAASRSSKLHLSLHKLSGNSRGDEDLVLRGLYFGIVDEADSVLVDEARTPLILSSSGGASEEKVECEQALDLARRLDAGADFTVTLAERNIVLTEGGRSRLDDMTEPMEGVWTSARGREELVTRALSALVLFRRDQHYVVSEGKVQIVDESTGRVMPDRSWERGLHQLIELKEGCPLTERRETLARLTYQRLFRRYLRLAGMTGTAREVAREIRSVYGLEVVRVPLHRPSRRLVAVPTICRRREEKWRTVADVVRRLAITGGRPVLIGTRSVRASEEISGVLGELGIPHALLNAKQDQTEAEVVALAAQPGRVTVATNMAGRGTDIRLGQGVAERGGLHVILTEYHESRRIDRQLFGRCARQGDPGSCEAIVSLEDEIFLVHASAMTRSLQWMERCGLPPAVLHGALHRVAQWRAERLNAASAQSEPAADRSGPGREHQIYGAGRVGRQRCDGAGDGWSWRGQRQTVWR
jgi:preprotein translocase subunit SecA